MGFISLTEYLYSQILVAPASRDVPRHHTLGHAHQPGENTCLWVIVQEFLQPLLCDVTRLFNGLPVDWVVSHFLVSVGKKNPRSRGASPQTVHLLQRLFKALCRQPLRRPVIA